MSNYADNIKKAKREFMNSKCPKTQRTTNIKNVSYERFEKLAKYARIASGKF